VTNKRTYMFHGVMACYRLPCDGHLAASWLVGPLSAGSLQARGALLSASDSKAAVWLLNAVIVTLCCGVS
jgi:hypothetical protein